MRRPLLVVCLILSVIAIVHGICMGSYDRAGMNELTGTQEMLVTGRVRKIERKSDKIFVWIKIRENSIQVDRSDPDQIISQIIPIMKKMKTDMIRCNLEAQGDEPVPRIGSEVVMRGRFAFFREATNPGEYNTAAYYHGLGVGGSLQGAVILNCSEGYDHIREGLRLLQEYFQKRLDRVFPERESGVLKAMLLGERSELEPELKELYRDGGILHILSISGLHVTLLGMGLFKALRRLGVRQSVSAVAGGTILIFYGIMTGMSVSACRAIGMFLLRMLSLLMGRTYDLLTALAVLAAAMLCTEPLYALQPGFWLSFGAMAGVSAILPVMSRLASWEPGNLRPGESRGVKLLRRVLAKGEEGLRAGAAVMLATLPLLLLFYFEVPVYSSCVNLLVIPLMGALIGLGFLVMLIPGTGPMGFVVVWLLKWFETLCGAVRKLPCHTWNPGCPGKWQIVGYYLLLSLLLLYVWIRKGRRLWMIFLPLLLLCIPRSFSAEATFLDVGQGDCACIQTAGGKVLLSDCGSSNRDQVGRYVLVPFLKYQGITRIDAVFLSHGDRDHVSGVEELLELAGQEGITIKALYLPDLGEERTKTEFAGVLQAAERVKGLRVYEIGAGEETAADGGKVQGRDFRIRVLHPSRQLADNLDSNEASLCLMVDLYCRGKGFSVLLTGDVEGTGEERLIAEMNRQGVARVNVLKCAHHGSKYATSESFLDALDAQLAVISCGKRNSYGHPHEELLERLEQEGSGILRTDQGGAVRVLFDGKKCKAQVYLQGGF